MEQSLLITTVQESLSFADIAKKWQEECQENQYQIYNRSDDDNDDVAVMPFSTETNFCYLLVNSAIWGGFEFVEPKLGGTKMEYISVLSGKQEFDDILTTHMLHERLHESLFNHGLIHSIPNHPFKQQQIDSLDQVSLQAIYAKMATDIYTSREYFHRWCRVALEDILYGMELGKKTVWLTKPKFWGNSWEDALYDRLYFAESNKSYPLWEAAKFFLDPDLWDDYSEWVKTKTKKHGRIHANHYNLYLDAQEKLKEHLKTGELSASGHLDKHPNVPSQLLPTDKFKDGLIELDYDRNKAKLFGKLYVGVTVAKCARNIGLDSNKKNTRKGKEIAKAYSLDMYYKIIEDPNNHQNMRKKNGKPHLTEIAKFIFKNMKLSDEFKNHGHNFHEKSSPYSNYKSILNVITAAPRERLKPSPKQLTY